MKASVTTESIDVGRFLGEIEMPAEHGAQVVFTGVVRNRNHGRQVVGVSYDAHGRLAEKIFAQIAGEARTRWGDALHVVVAHRIGRLAVGETSVLIVVTSPHRHEAYEASRFVIDELKRRAPIWKQEHYVDGDSEWLPGHALCQGAHA